MQKEMLDALNQQVYEESNSAYIYVGIAAWLGTQGLRGMERWMIKQVEEELEHSEKFYKYISAHGKVVLKALPAPKTEWSSALEAFEAADKHEKYITGRIKNLVEQAEKLGDKETKDFLQWFVKEQVEEEENSGNNVKMIKAAKGDLKAVDEMMGKRGG